MTKQAPKNNYDRLQLMLLSSNVFPSAIILLHCGRRADAVALLHASRLIPGQKRLTIRTIAAVLMVVDGNARGLAFRDHLREAETEVRRYLYRTSRHLCRRYEQRIRKAVRAAIAPRRKSALTALMVKASRVLQASQANAAK